MLPTLDDLYFILIPLGILAIVAAIILAVPQLWTRSMGHDDSRRNHTMDGARGLLSLWVLTHHLIAIPYMLTHTVPVQSSHGAVAMLMSTSFFTAPFYSLTAMLFGGALLATGGKLNTLTFLQRRFFRLTPVYALSIVLIVATAFFMTGFHLQVPALKLMKSLARWCSFGFLPMYDINGAKVTSWHGMLWTLPYEIIFYAMLPVLAWGQRRAKSPLILIGGLALASFVSWQFVFFTTGVIAAAATRWKHRHVASIWSVLTLSSLFLLGATSAFSGPVIQAVLLLPILVAAATQVPIMRPFQAKPIRFVGEISYSIYILHFPLICILYTLVISPTRLNQLSYLERTAALAGIGSLIVIIAALSYMFIERPIIAFGKNWKPLKQSGSRPVVRECVLKIDTTA